MRFYTNAECEEWLQNLGRQLPTSGDRDTFRLRTNSRRHDYPLLTTIANNHTYRNGVLLWLTEWGVWRSTENWHLYYAMRHLRGDHRLLHEAPGHLFLSFEMEDLTTFLQIAILNGWGGYVLTEAGYLNAFFSHDEYIELYGQTSDLRAVFSDSSLP